jgi:hypothetical protein
MAACAPTSFSAPRRAAVEAHGAAPDFELPRLDGRRVSLSDYRGHAVLVIVFDPRAPGLRRQMADWEHLARDVAPGLEVLPVARVVPLEGAERDAAQAVEGSAFAASTLLLRHAYEAPAWADGPSSTFFALVAPDGSVRVSGDMSVDLRAPRVESAARAIVGGTRAVATSR